MKDFYAILGVSDAASEADIKTAYRKLAMQWHPDKNPGDTAAEAKFKEINEAHDTLKDPAKRAEYNRTRMAARHGTNYREPHRAEEAPWNKHTSSFDTDVWDDLFRQYARNAYQPPTRNRDQHITMMITLEEAYSGLERTVTFTTESMQTRTISVKIPPGSDDGQKIRFEARGENIHPGKAGDLYVNLRVTPHHRFVRHGNNLATSVEVDYIDAMLGKELDVRCIDGSTIRIKCPPGIRPGQSLKATGRGMPVPYTLTKGDLIVEVVLVSPLLTPEQKERLSRVKTG